MITKLDVLRSILDVAGKTELNRSQQIADRVSHPAKVVRVATLLRQLEGAGMVRAIEHHRWGGTGHMWCLTDLGRDLL